MDKRQQYGRAMRTMINHIHQFNIEKGLHEHTKDDRLELEYRDKSIAIFTKYGMPMWRSDDFESLAIKLGLSSYISIAYRHGIATIRLSVME